MKKLLIFAVTVLTAMSLFACKSKQDTTKSEEVAGLKSPVTEGDTLCICAEYETDMDIPAKLTEEGYTSSELATGSFRENSAKLFHTDDSDMLIYTFDDAYLAGKAYTSILNGEADGAYPTNFVGLSGSLVRMGKYVIDDSISDTGTGNTLRKVFSVAGVKMPKSPEQIGFENRVSVSDKGVLKKGFKKQIKKNGYQVVELDVSIHAAQKSYLIIAENGIIAGRLDINSMELNELKSFAEAVAQAYNAKIGITVNPEGYALYTWYTDCIDAVFTETITADTKISDAAVSEKTKSEG